MAWLIVYMEDPPHMRGKPREKRRMASRAGDVLAVLEDHIQPGTQELADPRFRCIHVPDASVSDLAHLEEPVTGLPDARGEMPMVAKRRRRLSRTALARSMRGQQMAKWARGDEMLTLTKSDILGAAREHE